LGDDSNFVFHLHHKNGVPVCVHGAQMAHQFGKGQRIRISCRHAKWGEPLRVTAVAGLDPRESVRVRLHPGRHIAGIGVFPGAKPEEHESQIVLAGPGQQPVHAREIKLSFFRLDGLPGDRQQNRIQMHRGQPRPDGLHVLDTGGTRVMQLSTKHEEWIAIDNELSHPVAFFQMGNSTRLGGLLADHW
jgi:hypothetical protein